MSTYISAGFTEDRAKDPLGTIELALESTWLADTQWWTDTNTALTAIKPCLGIKPQDIHFGYYPEEYEDGRLWVWITELDTQINEPDIPGNYSSFRTLADVRLTVRDTEHHRRARREPILVEMRAYVEQFIKQRKRFFVPQGIRHVFYVGGNYIEKEEISDYHEAALTILVTYWKVSTIML
ncbi:MAG TPA: hypothetical protein VGE97_03470 [Nitrososphaera sp.]|jgi:hypothetical protein